LRSKLGIPSLIVLLVALLVSCGGGGPEAGTAPEDRPFPELEKAARGTTVNFFMYGGDDATNAYVDD
jgi:putative spermidine/putrescine transport system substrate-binding protein